MLAGVPDWLWNGQTLPVPVDDIADSCFGLWVREVELRSAPGVPEIEETRGLSGLLLPSIGEIWVSAPEARRVARPAPLHDLPRARPLVPASDRRRRMVPQARGRPARRRRARPRRPRAEAEADEFAAALLMPAGLIRRHYERIGTRPDRFELLCTAFGASGAAMSRRLRRVI